MPLHDDATIPDDALLLRALPHGWTTTKGGRYRPASHAFLEVRGEVSLFVDGPGVLDEVRRIFPGLEIASVSASVIRRKGLVIERRPLESPEGFLCDPICHVVVGPNEQLQRPELERRYRSLAKDPAVTILSPEQSPQ
jgi:hypothetical protein